MKESLVIRHANNKRFYSVFWNLTVDGKLLDTADNLESMAEQCVAILLGWADPVEVE